MCHIIHIVVKTRVAPIVVHFSSMRLNAYPIHAISSVEAVIKYYNYRYYHEGVGDVTPYDVYTGRHLEILQNRKEAKSRALLARRDYNRAAREQGNTF